MTTLSARWVLPVAGTPLRDGWVSVSGGRVHAVGQGVAPGPVRDLGDVVLMPGLVNAHTHVELSWMAGRVPEAASMDEWIRTLMQVRRTGPPGGDAEVVATMTRAALDMGATGTVLVGDISNTLASVPVIESSELEISLFHEILGFNPVDPAGMVREAQRRLNELVADWPASRANQRRAHSVVAHAPYSTAPALFAEIAARHEGPAPLTVHVAESAEEVEFLHTGRGPIRTLLETLGVWSGSWEVPRCGPVDYLKRVGYLQPGTLLVHCVHLTVSELEAARDADAIVVTCPRSNVWVGGGVPPVSRFYGAGVPVAIGTDSLASTDSLSMFDELAALRRLAPEVDAARLIESATRVGAEALGWGLDYGTLAAGRLARLVTVELPAGIGRRGGDVEEYLVSGITADAIGRVDLPAA